MRTSSEPGVLPLVTGRLSHAVVVEALQAVPAGPVMASVRLSTGADTGKVTLRLLGATTSGAILNDQVAPLLAPE